MDKPVVNAPAQGSGHSGILSLDRILAVVWESAVDALIKSILVTVLGSIAIGLASGIWEEMAPSAPPGFSSKPEAEANPSTAWHSWGASLNHHRFLIVFGLIFVLTFWFRLARRNGKGEESKGTSRLQRIGKHLSES